MGQVIDFYTNKSRTPEGLKLEDIWQFNDWQLENTHKFIQWLFPLELASHHNDTAPVMTDKEIQNFMSNPKAINNLLHSLKLMESFYGFKVNHTNKKLKHPKDFRSYEDKDWFTQHNHNFIRITRILHSLVVLGLEKEAKELFNYLEEEVYATHRHEIGENAYQAWKEAMKPKVA